MPTSERGTSARVATLHTAGGNRSAHASLA